MRAFDLLVPDDVTQAVAEVGQNPEAAFLAGGTAQLDLMKDGVARPDTLVDLSRLPLRGVARHGEVLRIGALTTMAELAADPAVGERLPLLRESLLLSASVQLRNMATIGGNLLQRTRCRHFRDPAVPACNKRDPGSGCAARAGNAREAAVLGVSRACVAAHASDPAVALVALDASVTARGPDDERRVPLTAFYLTPGATPHRENALRHGELVTEVDVPLPPEGARSGYLKVRGRASFDFALVSAAAVVTLRNGRVEEARIGLGGVGTVPWRAGLAEEILRGARPDPGTFDDAAAAALATAETLPGNGFKVELARRALVRLLETVTGEAR
ncbi:FAD binding domain-containing protein [Actinomadura kijaniata]|uniref:FAD binding domain-containing protein n=1 Tax=Actinomadura kijaniata TaxID=46161 RepID=UPI003F1E0682